MKISFIFFRDCEHLWVKYSIRKFFVADPNPGSFQLVPGSEKENCTVPIGILFAFRKPEHLPPLYNLLIFQVLWP
jgi:hypothetical protein